MARRKSTHPTLKAATWMIGTLLSFTVMAVAVRQLHGTMGTFEILFFRSLVGLIITVAIVARVGWSEIRTYQPKMQVGRNIIHYGGQFGWVLGLSLLPLTEVFAIEFTIPLWTAILAITLLGERMNRGRAVAMIAGFVGILVILRPGIEIIDVGALVMIGAAMCFAGSIVCTKTLIRTDRPLAILFYMSLIQLPMGLVPALFQWVTPGWTDLPWLLIVGLCALTAHYSLANAFLHADATIVMPMEFMRLPLIALVAYILYNEPLEFFVFLGAALIFAGNYYSIRRESRL
ncbi:MAG: DMT family transporter [Alphaproteobacteria bacterium]|jgi:drug/metabolite transporter (DMT)-like permease|nr:DMT family transporter [Alphaproteobacteria bacterium]